MHMHTRVPLSDCHRLFVGATAVHFLPDAEKMLRLRTMIKRLPVTSELVRYLLFSLRHNGINSEFCIIAEVSMKLRRAENALLATISTKILRVFRGL